VARLLVAIKVLGIPAARDRKNQQVRHPIVEMVLLQQVPPL
jgi:hypothetical protein